MLLGLQYAIWRVLPKDKPQEGEYEILYELGTWLQSQIGDMTLWPIRAL